jgi:hypothetical protein
MLFETTLGRDILTGGQIDRMDSSSRQADKPILLGNTVQMLGRRIFVATPYFSHKKTTKQNNVC